jgi:AcrR family transcriptional regulator
MGRLLSERGHDFTLPDLARESGFSTATVYRHFADLTDLRQEFYDRHLDALLSDLAALSGRHRGDELLRATCDAWIRRALPAARAAALIRSADGYLERVRAGDPFVRRLHHEILVPILEQLIEDSVLPDQDREYAALIWITLFDERVLLDLGVALGWESVRISDTLRGTLVSALTPR